jgi:hypothetical protein
MSVRHRPRSSDGARKGAPSRSRRGFRLARYADEGLLETQHHEISLEHMAHTELGLELNQGAQAQRGIGAILQIADERWSNARTVSGDVVERARP